MFKPTDYIPFVILAGRIDHAHHKSLARKALTETLELNKAVQKARDMTSVQDTLIVSTADHSHVFTISGYPLRGHPILGKCMQVRQGNVGWFACLLATMHVKGLKQLFCSAWSFIMFCYE